MIHTRRLTLRRVERSDTEDFFEYSHDPSVGPASGWEPHADLRRTRFIMRMHYLKNPFAWGIIYEGKLIGSISLDTDRKRFNDRIMMLGYSLSSKYWGMGIMSEAAPAVIKYMFDNYDMDAISVYCYPENVRSKRIIEKCGFEYEGLLHMAQRRYDGKVMDNMCYLLTQKRFNAVKNSLPVYK